MKKNEIVTPYAGVWIEMQTQSKSSVAIKVTPYAGVWIEIFLNQKNLYSGGSLPTRECGLKFGLMLYKSESIVTPYAGVWIEITVA